MQISPAANPPKAAIDMKGLSSRYEALIRLAQLIRSHPEEKDLFQTCARELHQVVPLDGMSQFDSAANWVQWHIVEPYNSEFEVARCKALPKGGNRRMVGLPQSGTGRHPVPSDCETRFPLVVERLAALGLSSCARCR